MTTILLAAVLASTVRASPEALSAAGATKLVELVELAGLADTLAGGEFTVFAPTNEAIGEVPMATLATILADPEALKQMLLEHVVAGKALSSELANELVLPTLGGGSIRANIYSTLPNYQNFTTINGAVVVEADVPAGDSVVHLVASVLPPTPSSTITDLVGTEERFSMLKGALASLDLLDTLAGEGPFTLFAPTNEAFAQAPQEALAALMSDQVAFKNLFLNHVVPETVFKEGLSWVTRATLAPADRLATHSFQNGTVKVLLYTVQEEEGSGEGSGESPVEGRLYLSAWLTETDIVTSNGVLHSFDNVEFY